MASRISEQQLRKALEESTMTHNPHELRLCSTEPPEIPDSLGLTEEALARFRLDFESEPRYRLARNSCTKHDPEDLARTRQVEETISHHFQFKVEPEVGPMVDQLQCGRCWAFSAFNAMRIPVAKALNVSEFEFSCNHLFFWNTMERTNYLLHAFVDTARRGEPIDSRTVWTLTAGCGYEGGDWYKFRNIVEKYGVMPKSTFPNSWTSKYSEHCTGVIGTKTRACAVELRKMVEENKSEIEIQQKIEDRMNEFFRIMSICTGTPPERFTWEYKDRDGKLNTIGPITPRDFFETHVRPVFDPADKILLINDERPGRELGRLYSHEYTANMVNGFPPMAINTTMQTLKDCAAASIKGNQAVYFGAHHKRHWSFWEVGTLDLEVQDYELLFGTKIYTMDRVERNLTNDASNSHAMILTGFSEKDGKPYKWRVENCWGLKGGGKGFYVMTDDWFGEYMFQIVVDRKFVPEEVANVHKQDPIVLPVWDEGKF